MSKQEFSRLDVLLRVQSGQLRVSDACALIGLQRRQVFRPLRGLKQDGRASLLSSAAQDPGTIGSALRFAPWRCRSARAIRRPLARPPAFAGAGPPPARGQVLAAKKLAEHHRYSISRATLRGWMTPIGCGAVRG